MERCKNVFEAILKYGHDEEWSPDPNVEFEPTDAPAGSPEKIEVLRKRLELGLPLCMAWKRPLRLQRSNGSDPAARLDVTASQPTTACGVAHACP
jgi:hypothetical protein